MSAIPQLPQLPPTINTNINAPLDGHRTCGCTHDCYMNCKQRFCSESNNIHVLWKWDNQYLVCDGCISIHENNLNNQNNNQTNTCAIL
jgi:hypothetical protein